MVLVNGLTIDDINAALIALQRGQGEVVGGVKQTTVQNISISNSGGSGGPDFTPQINALQETAADLTERVETLEDKQTETEQTIDEIITRLNNAGIQRVIWQESNRTLYFYMSDRQLFVEIPAETVTLTLGNDNVLHFTMGEGENAFPQTIDLALPFIRTSEKGVAGGVASLDSNGRVPYSQLPAGAVSSVNGQTGDVTLDANDIDYSSTKTIKQAIDDIQPVQADWEQTNSLAPDYIKNKIPIWIESGSASDNMTPVNSVTSGEMRPVTSNAVYDSLQNVGADIDVYDTVADAEADLSNHEVGDFIATEEGGSSQVVDAVVEDNMHAVTSNAVARKINTVAQNFASHFLAVAGAGGGTVYVKIRLRNYNKQGAHSVFVAYNCYSEWGVMRESSQCYYRGASYGVQAISWTSYTVDNNDYFWVKFSGYYNIQFVSSHEMYIDTRTTTAPSGITFTNKVAWT